MHRQINDDIEVPYVRDDASLCVITAQMAMEVLWRECGYDERKPTPEDVSKVVAGLDAAKAEFLARAAEYVVIDGRPNLTIVKTA